ncbi:hypothetical protein BST61_g7377 [Cercospora zeina]
MSPGSADIPVTNDQFLQKPTDILDGTTRTLWNVPAVYKYNQEQAHAIPAAAKLHAMSVHRIEKHWHGVNVATGCLPPELESKTPYSLAMLTRLDELAYLTVKKHEEALSVLRYAHKERRAGEEEDDGGPKLHPRISTVPKEIWKQNKAQVVESTIWENREGLLLQDVDRAVAIMLAEGKKVRNEKTFSVKEGEKKGDVKRRIMRERKKEKREVEKVVRKVVGSKTLERRGGTGDDDKKGEKAENEYDEIEKLLGRGLRKWERKQVGRTRQKIAASAAAGSGGSSMPTSSLASSGQGGSVFMVGGLVGHAGSGDVNDNEKKTKAVEKTPAMSEEGRKFLQEHKYVDDLSLQELLEQKMLSLGQATGETMVVDKVPAHDPLERTDKHTRNETGEGKDAEELLSNAMRDRTISPGKNANGGELEGDTKMQLE